MDYDIRMNITPYTPIPELRKYVRMTYLRQAYSCALGAGNIVLAYLNFLSAESSDSELFRIVGALCTAVCVIGACLSAETFVNWANCRFNLRYLIWVKQQDR